MGKIAIDNIKNDFLKIVSKLSGMALDQLHDGMRFKEDLGFDSLKSVEAISRITELYDFMPDLEEIMGLGTIGEVVEYIETKVS